jgi:hypothetical protein
MRKSGMPRGLNSQYDAASDVSVIFAGLLFVVAMKCREQRFAMRF